MKILHILFFSALLALEVFYTSGAVGHDVGAIQKPTSINTPTQRVSVHHQETRGLVCPPIILTTQNGSIGDGFGKEVAMDGNVAIIAAPYDDTNGEDAGAVYVFRKSGNVWVEEQKLLASDGLSGDKFGHAVSIHSGVLVVGSFIRRQVYVYVFDGTSWQEQTILTPWDADIGGGDRFGISLEINNGLIAVGAVMDSLDCNSFNACGSVYVFRKSEVQWLPETKLRNSIPNGDPESWNWFGASIAIDGDVVVVGNPQFGWFSQPGTIHIFRFDGSSWNEEAILTGSISWIWDRFGTDVAIHNNELIASSPFGSSAVPGDGFAYTFWFDGQNWNEASYLFEPEGLQNGMFGLSIDIDAQFALVSTEYFGQPSIAVYTASVQSWFQLTHLIEPGGASGDFGSSVSLFGTTALIGSSDAAYIYDLSGDSCSVIGDVTGDGLVNVSDLLAVIDLWGSCSACPADLDGSGVVDVDDLLIVIANWD